MPRRRASPAEFANGVEREAAAASLDALVARKRPRGKGGGKGAVQAAVEDARGRASSGDWEGAAPRSLVALYYVCHTEVYGAEPGELRGEQWAMACRSAGALVKTEFGGDLSKAVEYVRWTWRREQWREGRRSDEQKRWRVTWRQQFAQRNLLSDYRTELARRARSGRRWKC